MPKFLHASVDSHWLASSNHPDMVPRSHLLDALYAHRARPLRLLLAPNGGGKTTLLQQYYAHHHEQCVWLSLGPEDTSSNRFFQRLTTVIQQHQPDFQGTILCHEFGDSSCPPLHFTALFVRALGQLETNLTIIIDDVQWIRETPWFSHLIDFIQQSRGVNWLLACNRKPTQLLDQISADQRFILTQDDLYFSADESSALLSRHGADDAFIDSIIKHTQGWPAGIKLAQVALANAAIPTIISTQNTQELFEGMADTLLDQLDQAVNGLLTKTAFLDCLNESLCAHLLQDSNAASDLSRLLESRYVLDIQPNHRLCFRYSPLLRQRALLRFKLLPESERKHLVDQACQWLAENDLRTDGVLAAHFHPHPAYEASYYLKNLVNWVLSGKLQAFYEHQRSPYNNGLKTIPQARAAWLWLLTLSGRTREAAASMVQLLGSRTLAEIMIAPADIYEANIAAAYGNLLIQQGKSTPELLAWQNALLLQEQKYKTVGLTVHANLAEAMLDQQRWPEATHHITQVMQQAAEFDFEFHLSIAWQQQIRLLYQNNDPSTALQLCNLALQRDWRFASGSSPVMLQIVKSYLLYRTSDRAGGLTLCLQHGSSMLSWLPLQTRFAVYHILLRETQRNLGSTLALELLDFVEAFVAENDSAYYQSLVVLERFRLCVASGDEQLALQYYGDYELARQLQLCQDDEYELDGLTRMHYLICGVFYHRAIGSFQTAYKLVQQLLYLNVERGLPEYHLMLSLLEPWLDYCAGEEANGYSKLNAVLRRVSGQGTLLGALDDIPELELMVHKGAQDGRIQEPQIIAQLQQLKVI